MDRAITPTAPARAEPLLRGTETLLVVEDEEPLRRGTCKFLRTLGYRVLAANSAEEALSMANDEERVDLLLTDVIMPGMNGRELSQALRGMRPELRVIYVSGYTDDAVLWSGIHAQRDGFLQKPFGLSHLARKVRDILDWSEPGHENTAAAEVTSL